MNVTVSSTITGLALGLIALTLWRHWAVTRFFARARQNPPPPDAMPRLVSILQPILSGDPTLPATLGHNLARKFAGSAPGSAPHGAQADRRQGATNAPGYEPAAGASKSCEFLWLLDADDAAAHRICGELIAAHPTATVRVLTLPAPAQGVNPKTFKLIAGLESAAGDVICVLDDDTMLPDDAFEVCLPYLSTPRAGLAFGLPYQVHFANPWSALVALFVNANSLPTYVPYASLHEPVTINGMFYMLHRTTLAAIGGFTGLEQVLADDFAIARRVRGHGLRLVQTPLRHAISTHVPSPRRYLSLIQRWFIFPRESLLRHLPPHEQALLYVLALVPTLLPPLLLVGLLLWPARAPAVALAAYFALTYGLFIHLDRAYLRNATPLRWSFAVPLLQVLFPLQLLAALLLPQRITWRGHVMQVERGGSFRFLRRR